jgi:hypothetical protein
VRNPLRGRSWLTVVAVLAPPAILYLLTLYPGVGGRTNPGDSAKFQFLGKLLGVPHDPGYPQYMVLNHLWTRIPTPLELATHVNLLSTVFALVAGGLIFAALRRLSGNGLAAAIATWTLLLSHAVWTVSTEAEVYSLHLAYVCGVLWAGIRWRETRQRSWLIVLIGIAAFSFGNHPLSVALLPAVLAVAVGVDRHVLMSGRTVAAAVMLVGLSLSQYLYLWWRSRVATGFLDGLPQNATVRDVLDTMMGARFSGRFVLRGGLDAVLERSQALSGEFLQLTLPALVLAAVGFVALMRRDRVLGAFVALLGIGPLVFVLMYQIRDWGGYVPPIWVAAVTLAAVGAATPKQSVVRGGVFAFWMIALTWLTASTFQAMHVSTNRFDRSALLEVAEPNSIVLTYLEQGRGYRERQLTNYYRFGLDAQQRLGIDVVLAGRAFDQRRAYLSNRPIYFSAERIRQHVDQYRMDYVEKEMPGDPSYRYFVSSALPGRESLRIEPVRNGGTRVTVGEKELVAPTDSIHVAVMGASDGRVKGVTSFEWDDADGPSPHPALSFLERVRHFDWVAIVWQGDLLPRRRLLAEQMLAEVGATTEPTPVAKRSLVAVGKRGLSNGWRVLVDVDQPVDVALTLDR